MEKEQPGIQPGDRVICIDYLERGYGIASYVSYEQNQIMIAYGPFGDMSSRILELTTLDKVKK